MILNYDHYRSGQRKRRPRWLIPVGAVAAVGLIVVLFALKVPQKIFASSATRAGTGKIPALWKAAKYDDVISVADAALSGDPLNAGLLAYRGFASFYKAISEINAEDKVPYLDDAVVYLRRAELAGTPMKNEADYVLAKAYFFKGKFYYDLSISRMTAAIGHGFVQNDSYEYLGLAYSQLGELSKGIECFLKALDQGQTDILLLTIGQTYYQMKDTGNAVDYLMRTLNKTEDKAIEKKARSLLGEIYLDRNELFKAEEQYSALITLDPQSADAHFYLGEVYSKMNDRVKARAEWRAAFQIDPSHYGARLRLFK